MNRRARRAAGRKSKKASRGAETSASSAAAFCSEAFTQLKAGRLLDAQISCQQALAIDPAHTDGLHLMGRLALETGQHDHAVEWLRRAMASAPRADCAGLLGKALQGLLFTGAGATGLGFLAMSFGNGLAAGFNTVS